MHTTKSFHCLRGLFIYILMGVPSWCLAKLVTVGQVIICCPCVGFTSTLRSTLLLFGKYPTVPIFTLLLTDVLTYTVELFNFLHIKMITIIIILVFQSIQPLLYPLVCTSTKYNIALLSTTATSRCMLPKKLWVSCPLHCNGLEFIRVVKVYH